MLKGNNPSSATLQITEDHELSSNWTRTSFRTLNNLSPQLIHKASLGDIPAKEAISNHREDNQKDLDDPDSEEVERKARKRDCFAGCIF